MLFRSSAAIKKGALSHDAYSEMIATTTSLNRIGADLALDPSVHAMTDVTGFGLLGHALEMARGSKLQLVIRADQVPLLNDAKMLVQQGVMTGASKRNWESYGHAVVLPDSMPEWRRHLLTDPQTSGGLLIACSGDQAARLMTIIRDAGHEAACVIGYATDRSEERRVGKECRL